MDRQTHLFDAKGKVLGRLATEVAQVLSGRDRVDFAPHIDAGATVVIINADQIALTGNKENDKRYYRFSGYPGGIKNITVKDQRKKDASKMIEQAVRGMLPKNKLASKMMNRLYVYNNQEHNKVIQVDHTA